MALRLPSPVRPMFQGSRAMRSILKRPTPLPLSPAAPVATFSSLLSPSYRRSPKSPAPHVRFPSSPSQLVVTISTFKSDTYDRSPSPVGLPGWAEREDFRLTAAQRVFRSLTLTHESSPVISEFQDPRSPRLQPAADVTGAKAANAIRFAQMATQGTPPTRIKPLEKSLASYPRSPYPTAKTPETDDALDSKEKQVPHTANEVPARPPRERQPASNRNKLGLTLNRSDFAPSPLSQSYVGTAHSSTSLNRPKKPAPLTLESHSTESDKLSNAFWNSVSIESADLPMVTALEYPESAVEYEEKIDIGIRSSSQPPLMFGGADGVLFSPGLPKVHSRVKKLRESIQQVTSPCVKRTSFVPIARKEVTAPSPNDPFAAFPSFGAVLEHVDSPIQYPAAVAQDLRT